VQKYPVHVGVNENLINFFIKSKKSGNQTYEYALDIKNFPIGMAEIIIGFGSQYNFKIDLKI
jgi:hypothetical protein